VEKYNLEKLNIDLYNKSAAPKGAVLLFLYFLIFGIIGDT